MVPGKARPSSSAVRVAPTAVARSRVPPQAAQDQPTAGTAAPPRTRGRPARPVTRAGLRRPGTGPARGRSRRPAPAGSRPGAPAPGPGPIRARPRAVRQARLGSRAARAAASRPLGAVVGRADRRRDLRGRVARGADTSGPSRSGPAAAPSAVRDSPPTSRPPCSRRDRRPSTLADVRVGRARLGVQVVPVVPHHDEARAPRTGANIADRVPITARQAPRRTASQRP